MMQIRKIREISALRLFGSAARGDADEVSDIDILAVLRMPLSSLERRRVELETKQLGSSVSITWYGEAAIKELFDHGHLFAFHVFKESVPLIDGPLDFVNSLGKPNPYRTAVEDVAGFQRILAGVPNSLNASDGNAAYEAGMLYVCARNIAMIASSRLDDGPYFGRQSPFQLATRTGISFPLTEQQHKCNMIARTAGLRGHTVIGEAAEVRGMADAISDWAMEVARLLKKRGDRGMSQRNNRFFQRVEYERSALASVNSAFGSTSPLAALSSPALDAWQKGVTPRRGNNSFYEVVSCLYEISRRLKVEADSSREVFDQRPHDDGLDLVIQRLQHLCSNVAD